MHEELHAEVGAKGVHKHWLDKVEALNEAHVKEMVRPMSAEQPMFADCVLSFAKALLDVQLPHWLY